MSEKNSEACPDATSTLFMQLIEMVFFLAEEKDLSGELR